MGDFLLLPSITTYEFYLNHCKVYYRLRNAVIKILPKLWAIILYFFPNVFQFSIIDSIDVLVTRRYG